MATKTTSGIPLPTIDPFKMALGGQTTPNAFSQATAIKPAVSPYALATGQAPLTPAVGGMSVYNPSTTYGSTSPAKAPVAPVTAINASQLTPQPTPVYPTVQTNMAGNTSLNASLAAIQEQALGIQSQLQKQQEQAAIASTQQTSQRSNVLDRILGLGNDLAGKGDFALDVNKENNIAGKAQQVTDLTNQYKAKERAYDLEIRKIEKENAQGIGAEVAASRIQDIQKNKNQELADIAIQQSAALGNYDTAREIAKQTVDAKYEPIQEQIQLLKDYYQLSADDLTESEKIQVQEKIQEKQAAADFDRQKDLYAYKQQIDQQDPLYQANLANVYSQIGARNAELQSSAASGNVDVNTLSGNGYSSAQNNGAAITAILANKNIGAGTRTQLANVLGVVNAAEELANNNVEGKFEGVNPLTGILNGKVFGIGLPFRDSVKGEKQIQNEGYIEAINLRTQIWASGASLTAEQINQVNRFTPRVSDTDASVQAKLNNLTNFMLGQTKTQLQSEGVSFQPAKVDLFETAKLIKQASPAQRAELKAQGLI